LERIANRTVLITGSTAGIGKAIAEAFAQLGYQIVFNGLEPNGAEIAADLAAKYKIEYLFSAANMMDPSALRNLVTEAIEHFGRIDILVNNAGIQFVSSIEEFPEDKWDAIIAVNLSAAFHLTKAVWPQMKANLFGRIINISSAHSLVASENKSAYVASKHGLNGLTKTTALEGVPCNITCNAICPGYVHTAIVEGQIANQMKVNQMAAEEVVEKVMLSKQALKEFIPMELIAKTVLFLAAEEARTITGVTWPIDAGWSAQ
jgi:3-hydroxybutyrate dehydrogenase